MKNTEINKKNKKETVIENKKEAKSGDKKNISKKQIKASEKNQSVEKNSEKTDAFSIAIVVCVAFLGTYAFLPWHGILSTIPIVIVSAFVCAFLKTSEVIKGAAFFFCPFSVSILLDKSSSTALFLSVCCVLIYFMVSFSIKFYKKKTNVYRTASAIVLILSLCLHVFVNSTPMSNMENRKAINQYVKNNYSDEKLLVSDIYFDSIDRTYSMSMVPEIKQDIALDLVFKDGKLVKDEFIDFSEKYNMIVGAGRITETLRNKYPDLRFLVESNSIKGYPFYISENVHLATTEPVENYARYMNFSVYFTSYNSIDEFISLSEECFRTLLTSGICCRTITFYGGIATRNIAKISVPFNSFVGNLSNYLTPCDNDVFSYSFM